MKIILNMLTINQKVIKQKTKKVKKCIKIIIKIFIFNYYMILDCLFKCYK